MSDKYCNNINVNSHCIEFLSFFLSNIVTVCLLLEFLAIFDQILYTLHKLDIKMFHFSVL